MPVVINAHGLPLAYSTTSTHHFSATDAGLILEGSATHDSMWGDSSVTVTLSGRAGDDIYHLYRTRNQAVADANNGVDTVKTWMSYVLPAHIEKLTVTGRGRQAVGNGIHNIVNGGSGTTTLKD